MSLAALDDDAAVVAEVAGAAAAIFDFKRLYSVAATRAGQPTESGLVCVASPHRGMRKALQSLLNSARPSQIRFVIFRAYSGRNL